MFRFQLGSVGFCRSMGVVGFLLQCQASISTLKCFVLRFTKVYNSLIPNEIEIIGCSGDGLLRLAKRATSAVC